MMKVIADSSSNIRRMEGVEFESVPLKINTSEKEYADDASLDLDGMLKELKAYRGKSGTSCPMEGVEFESVPLKINTSEKEYADDASLDLDGMLKELKAYRGKSGTSCPNFQNWMDAFGDAEEIFVTTITGELSGSYSAAVHAAREYEQEHPGRRVCVIDSRSAGPQIRLLVEKIRDLAAEGADFQTICDKIKDYHSHTRLLFCLESLLRRRPCRPGV